MADGRHIKIVI